MESLQGLRPWLSSLPSPADLKADIQGARDSIDTTLSPALAGLEDALAGLVTNLESGSYGNALHAVVGAESFLETTTQQADVSASHGCGPYKKGVEVVAARVGGGGMARQGIACAGKGWLNALEVSYYMLAAGLRKGAWGTSDLAK